MTLRVVGAGLGRTGTLSLKLALEKLLGGPCYHMAEVFAHPEHVPVWHAAARGEPVDWRALFAGYRAGVDWPQGSFWPEIAQAFPDALVLLSVRDADSWWQSASETIFRGMHAAEERAPEWYAMVRELFARGADAELKRLVPARVVAYAKSRGLYGASCEASSS